MLCCRSPDKKAFHPRRRNWCIGFLGTGPAFLFWGCLFPSTLSPFDTFDVCVVFAFSALLAQGILTDPAWVVFRAVYKTFYTQAC